MINRRRFLQNSAVVALTPTIPTFLARTLKAASVEKDQPILVVIQMDGGNDGINTVVPFKDEGYAASRKELRLKTSNLVKLSDEIGLHPRMRAAGELFEAGRLAIVQGVGYPNPNRSHFRSMAIWHSASMDVDDHNNVGWIGESISTLPARDRGPDAVYVGTDELPVALRGRRCVSATISSADDLALKIADLGSQQPATGNTEDLTSFIERNVLQAYSTAKELSESASKARAEEARYPGTRLGNRLKLVSQMIKSGAAARVYYASQPGYDTHAVQSADHANLLSEFSGGIKAFLDDLKTAGLEDRVLVMAFSEFGRRVKENGSLGTDHGTAGPVFLAGGKVKSGLHGTMPSLTDLDAGDLKYSTDFRNLYVTLIDNWLRVDRPEFLNRFDAMPAVTMT